MSDHGKPRTLQSGKVWCPHQDHYTTRRGKTIASPGVYPTREAYEEDHEGGTMRERRAPASRAASRQGGTDPETRGRETRNPPHSP